MEYLVLCWALVRWRLELVEVVLLLVWVWEGVRKVMMLQWGQELLLVVLLVVVGGVRKVKMLQWDAMKLLRPVQVKVSVVGLIDWVDHQLSEWILCKEMAFAA